MDVVVLRIETAAESPKLDRQDLRFRAGVSIRRRGPHVSGHAFAINRVV
jgi:hypothetical protein